MSQWGGGVLSAPSLPEPPEGAEQSRSHQSQGLPREGLGVRPRTYRARLSACPPSPPPPWGWQGKIGGETRGAAPSAPDPGSRARAPPRPRSLSGWGPLAARGAWAESAARASLHNGDGGRQHPEQSADPRGCRLGGAVTWASVALRHTPARSAAGGGGGERGEGCRAAGARHPSAHARGRAGSWLMRSPETPRSPGRAAAAICLFQQRPDFLAQQRAAAA